MEGSWRKVEGGFFGFSLYVVFFVSVILIRTLTIPPFQGALIANDKDITIKEIHFPATKSLKYTKIHRNHRKTPITKCGSKSSSRPSIQ